MRKCAHVHTLIEKIPERPQKKNASSTVHGSAAHIVLRPLPPPTVGCYPQAKTAPQNSLVQKNNKAEFSHTLWPRVYVSTEALTRLCGGWSHCRSSGSAMDSAVAEYVSPKLGQWVGRVQKKYNSFTHILHVGVEHRQMHSRAPAPKQEQRVKKQKSHTVTLKKFGSLLKNIPLVSKTSPNWVDISRAKCSKSGQRKTGPEASDSKD